MKKRFKSNKNHNRRSHDFRKKSNKEFLIGIMIIVLLSFVFAYDVGNIKTIVETGNVNIKVNSESLSIQQLTNTCPEGVIFDEMKLYGENTLSGYKIHEGNPPFTRGWVSGTDVKWEDGQKISRRDIARNDIGLITEWEKVGTVCYKGNKEGENQNLYYCPLSHSKTTTDISNEGVIGKTKTISYNIDLILERKELVEEYYKDIRIYNYEVISSDCMKK